MGIINCCSNREKIDTYTLPNMASNERKILHYLFSNLSSEHLKFQGEYLNILFKKTPNFGKKMVRFLRYLSSDQMDFELFKFQIHLFLRQPLERLDAPYNDYDILEIFCLVSMMKFGIPNLDYKSAISYMEAKEFFMDLTSLITEGSINEQLQQQLVKSFLHHLFSRDTIPMEFLDWEIFLKYIKDQLKNIPHFLRWIFSYKLLVQESCFLLPGFDKSSNFKEINNTAGLAFLMMSNIYVNLTKVIKLVYSSNSDGLVFDKLFQRITEFDGPTLILIKNVKGCIYGGFKSEKWEKGHEKLQGSPECYIFSLWPKFRNFFLKFNEKNDPKNSVYLNNVKNIGNRGIGFGFDEKNNCSRIWIDADIKNKSYSLCEDSMFGDGFLEESGSEHVMIEEIEVWGLEQPQAATSDDILSLLNKKIMKDLNKKMTEFLKNNQGSKLFDKEIQSEEDLYLKKNLKSVLKNEETIKKQPFQQKLHQTSFKNDKNQGKNNFQTEENWLNQAIFPQPKPEPLGRFINSDIYTTNLKISSKNEQNLEYHLHENNSDNGEEQEKKSYISVKLEPKMADSNLSSPSPVKEKIKKGQKDFFKHEDFSNNLITKPEKKIFEDMPQVRKTEIFSSRDIKEIKYDNKKSFNQNTKRALTPNSRNANDDYLRKTYNYYGQYREPPKK